MFYFFYLFSQGVPNETKGMINLNVTIKKRGFRGIYARTLHLACSRDGIQVQSPQHRSFSRFADMWVSKNIHPPYKYGIFMNVT